MCGTEETASLEVRAEGMRKGPWNWQEFGEILWPLKGYRMCGLWTLVGSRYSHEDLGWGEDTPLAS